MWLERHATRGVLWPLNLIAFEKGRSDLSMVFDEGIGVQSTIIPNSLSKNHGLPKRI